MINTSSKISKLFLAPWKICRYMELQLTKKQNTKILAAFLRWIFRKWKVFDKSFRYQSLFLTIENISKRLSVSLAFNYRHHLRDVIDKKVSHLALPHFRKIFKENHISTYTCSYITCIWCPKSYHLKFFIILPFVGKSS